MVSKDDSGEAFIAANRKRLIFILQICATVGAFAFLLSRIDVDQLLDAWRSLSPSAFEAALGWTMFAVILGATRWQMLLRAYGAQNTPPLLRLLHLYVVGNFYNIYVPGGVGGDVVRGVVSREAFEGGTAAATTSGVMVVFVERVCGVAALLTISALSFIVHPIAALDNVILWAGIGIAVAIAAVVGLAVAAKIAPLTPEPIARILRALPPLVMKRYFGVALILSLMIQLSVAFTGHAIMHSIWPAVQLSDSLALVPLAAASAFFPLTVGGAGVREAAFGALYNAVGVPEVTAYAGSLSFWGAQLIVGAMGGLVAIFLPISAKNNRS